MFLAAGPYFLSRLESNKRLSASFQSAELTVSTVANLGAMIILTNIQARASYPKRIVVALIINIGVFLIMTLSTKLFVDTSATGYFAFLMIQIFISSAATGLMQNGIFAYMASFGREEYAQGNMTGQAIAGVLPCVVQIVSVLSVSEASNQVDSTSALAYFATATGISSVTLLAFLLLLAVERRKAAYTRIEEASVGSLSPKKRIPLLHLYRKTFYLATSVFLTFAVTMFFPVFTLKIQSVQNPEDSSRLFKLDAFVPLAFLIWNSGDLTGRLLTAIPRLRITHKPRIILTVALARILFIPMYYLCNISGQGAVVKSDFFYFIIQLLFGISNGFIGTMCMMGAVEYVEVEERESTGAFMTLMLVGGLAAGSVLSFIVS
jgi:equilibrative nucleoside transporter 1/2/3